MGLGKLAVLGSLGVILGVFHVAGLSLSASAFVLVTGALWSQWARLIWERDDMPPPVRGRRAMANFAKDRTKPIVVFMIGSRIHNLWDLISHGKPLQVFGQLAGRQFGRNPNPPKGLLKQDGWGSIFEPLGLLSVQYWDSWEDLQNYATKHKDHLASWSQYNKQLTEGGVGIWHETYVVHPGDVENVYHHMWDDFLLYGVKAPGTVC
jgi:hypothetical protein